jgi:ornithine cyclodeaminase
MSTESPAWSGVAPIPFIAASEIERFGYTRAAAAIENALRGGLDPADDPPRISTRIDDEASMLYMPSCTTHGVGVKLVTHNPRNAAAGRRLLNGIYVLFDSGTLAPAAVLDGTALTALRTPAVSVTAVRPALRRFGTRTNVVIFGAGPQGVGHLDALCGIADQDRDITAPATATFVTRRERHGELPRRAGVRIEGAISGSTQAADALRAADIVVCASSAATPLFDSSLLGARTVTIAIGSHHPEVTELDTALCARAQVIVEDVATALRESGEVVQAARAGLLEPADLITIADVVQGRGDAAAGLGSGPVVFSGSGMAWQDLVVARAIVEGLQAG